MLEVVIFSWLRIKGFLFLLLLCGFWVLVYRVCIILFLFEISRGEEKDD